MDFNTAWDGEINEAVHALVFSGEGVEARIVNHNGMRRLSVNGFISREPVPDYCNSWADAGPIIESNKLDFTWFMDRERVLVAHEPTDTIHQSTNPLRAAMIVFLMMKDNHNG